MTERGGAKAWILAFVIAWPAGIAALVGIGCAIGANACPFGDTQELTTTDGREIWVSQCAVCHGVDGSGSPINREAPSLVRGPSAERTLEEIVAKVEGKGLGAMPRFEGKLTDEQIRAVADYVIALREGNDG